MEVTRVAELQLPAGEAAWDVRWRPGPALELAAAAGRTILLWQANPWRLKSCIYCESGFAPLGSEGDRAAAGADGAAGAYGGGASCGSRCAIVPATPLPATNAGAHRSTVRSLAWRCDGAALAAGSFDSTISVWREAGKGWRLAAKIEGHESEVKCVAWHPTRRRLLASCARDRSVWLHVAVDDEAAEWACGAVLHGHAQDVKSVSWHPSQMLLFSTSYDNTIKVWAERSAAPAEAAAGAVDDEGDENWRCVFTLKEDAATVWRLAFAPAPAVGAAGGGGGAAGGGGGGAAAFATANGAGELRFWALPGAAEPAQPAEPAKPAEPAELAEPAAPAAPAAPALPTAPASPAAPAPPSLKSLYCVSQTFAGYPAIFRGTAAPAAPAAAPAAAPSAAAAGAGQAAPPPAAPSAAPGAPPAAPSAAPPSVLAVVSPDAVGEPLYSVAWHPGGAIVAASGSALFFVRAPGRGPGGPRPPELLLEDASHADDVNAVDWSAGCAEKAPLLATASDDGTVGVFEVAGAGGVS